MRQLLKSLVKRSPIFLLLFIEIALFLTNYKAGTYLVGWDNLFPELNSSANIARSFFGVWQEYRGLGLLDGMSFAANLPHYLFVSFLSFFLPQESLRYFFVFLMHFLGGVGFYFLLQRLFDGHRNINILGSAGAIFYLFNLNTVQMFYAPYELFLDHFAFLPWLVLFLIRYLQKGGWKDIVFFTLFSIFAIPQAHVPTIFFVYLLFILTILSFSVFWEWRKTLKRSLVILLAIISINSYWLFPYLYSVPQNAKIIIDAKINQMSSEEVSLKNKARGNFSDVVFMKGFLLDMIEPDKNDDSNYIMATWREHTNTNFFKALAGLFALVALLGFINTLKEKRRILYPFAVVAIISFFFLGSNIWGIRHMNMFLREAIPVFAEALRFSFTKFSILFSFSYTVFFSLGLLILFSLLKKLWEYLALAVLFFLMFVYTLPSFQGNFLFDSLRLRIPPEYFETIEFLKNQDKNERVATLPQSTFGSWRFTNWGYRGSGFLWYGIPQPTLDRAFDPWSSKNENYYWELSYAVYSENKELFENVLEKYQVQWLLVDKNVINPSSPKATDLDRLIFESGKIFLVQTFRNIEIYKVNLEIPPVNFIFLAQNLPTVGPIYNWNNLDTAYLENGSYFSSFQSPASIFQYPDYYYPFRSFFAGREQKDLEFQVEELPTAFVFKSKIPAQLKNYRVKIPKADAQDLLAFPQRAYTKDRYLYLLIPEVGGSLAKEVNPSMLELPSCVKSKNGVVELAAKDGATCSISILLEALPHNVSYLITVKNQNVKGKPIVFWLENLNSRKADIETNLPVDKGLTESFFIQPSMDPFGQGYTLHFDNISIGKEEVVNVLGEIQIQPLPFNFLRSIKLVPPKTASAPNTVTNTGTIRSQASLITNVTHPNPAFYEVSLNEVLPSTTLVLSQSFDKGWRAYAVDSRLVTRNSLIQMTLAPLIGREVKEHVLVNNWANGWQLDESQAGLPAQAGKTIVIIYLPQYLEFAGFVLLFGFSVVLFLGLRRRTTLLRR